MKKIILLIISCLLLTGCTVNYNLTIEDNKFTETIKGNVLNEEIKIDENQTDVNIFYDYISKDQPALNNNNDLLYKKNLSKNNNSLDYFYGFTYDEETINNSRILNNCFENFKFEEKENIYYFMTDGNFYCDYTEEININVTTKYKVTYNNATKIKDNTYIWVINNDNKEDFELYIAVDKTNQSNNSALTWNIIKITCAIVLLTLSAIYLLIIRKKEQQY